MATPNYAYEKRQRELAKKRKADEKRLRKQHRQDDGTQPAVGEPSTGDSPAPARHGEPGA